MTIANPQEQAILVFGMSESGQEFIYRVPDMQEAEKLVELVRLSRDELDISMEIVPLSGYMTADAILSDIRELLGLDSEQDVTLEQYIEDYIEEERIRGNEIDMFTIQDATEAYEGGAR